MKKFFLASLLFVAGPAQAFEINSRIVDSVQLRVDGPAVNTQRLGGSYSVSGSNISATSFGGVGGTGTYDVNTAGQDFSFSESYNAADSVSISQVAIDSDGRLDSPVLYGESTTSIGGFAGSLAGTISATGASPTVTAGGPGTTAIAQTSIELSVFK